MQFKVGDRVEAIKPPNGVEEREADQIGLGRITAINADGQFGETHAVKLDSGDEWYYSEDRLRPIASKPTQTPSITVGTQVRLTGVVTGADGSGNLTVVLGEDFEVWIHPNKIPLEVIRQPFKRGEVVYDKNCPRNDYPAIVINDEEEGKVLLGGLKEGDRNQAYLADGFERRP